MGSIYVPTKTELSAAIARRGTTNALMSVPAAVRRLNHVQDVAFNESTPLELTSARMMTVKRIASLRAKRDQELGCRSERRLADAVCRRLDQAVTNLYYFLKTTNTFFCMCVSAAAIPFSVHPPQ